MKKYLILLVVLVAAGGATYYLFLWSPAVRTCDRIASLCGAEFSAEDDQRCESAIATVGDVGGEKAVAEMAACTESSANCAEAMGCLAGSSVRSIGGGLLKGIGKGLFDDNR